MLANITTKYVMLLGFVFVGGGCKNPHPHTNINVIKSELLLLQEQRQKIQKELTFEKENLFEIKKHISKLNQEHQQTKKKHFKLQRTLKFIRKKLEKSNYGLFEQSCRAKLSEIQSHVNQQIAFCSQALSIYYSCQAAKERHQSKRSLFGALLGATVVVLTGGTAAAILVGGSSGAFVGKSSANISCSNSNHYYNRCKQMAEKLQKKYAQERLQAKQLPKHLLYSFLQDTYSQERKGIIGITYDSNTMKITSIIPCSALMYKGYTFSPNESDYIHKVNGKRIHNIQDMHVVLKGVLAGDIMHIEIKQLRHNRKTYQRYSIMLGQSE